ncbi:MAG: cytidylate kinase-like family protein [Firmicutes bacterium]|nr:cytidylate kinase-like family protein [Bacillota bacterium]
MGNYVITISREYGSGGRIIGRKLAEALGIAFYDKQIINLLVQESGLPQATVEEWTEKKTPIAFYEVYMPIKERPVPDQIYLAKTRLIQNLADKESCVIVGNCADYILKDHPNCFNVFVHAPMEEKIRRVQEEYNEVVPNLEAHIRQVNKQRSAYYNYFTMNKWGERQNYHISVNSTIGIENAVDGIKFMLTEFLNGAK